MSSKNDILSAIRRHTGKRYDMPELTLDAITYEDKITQFTDSLKAAGGQAVLMQPGDDINDIIRHHFPDGFPIRYIQIEGFYAFRLIHIGEEILVVTALGH